MPMRDKGPSIPALEIELCDPHLIARMLTGRQRSRVARGLKGANLSTSRPMAMRSRRCKCGVCKLCAENQRWNRIFEEKFADHTYYSGPIIRYSSSLNSV